MAELSVWDDPDLAIGGDYVKFENEGDTVSGVIVAVRKQVWDDGSACPQLVLDVDGEEKVVTAGQIRLQIALREQRPAKGQHITITMTDIEKRNGGKTIKNFNVEVGHPAKAKPAKAKAEAPAEDGGFTDEQIEAMKLLGIDPSSVNK